MTPPSKNETEKSHPIFLLTYIRSKWLQYSKPDVNYPETGEEHLINRPEARNMIEIRTSVSNLLEV